MKKETEKPKFQIPRLASQLELVTFELGIAPMPVLVIDKLPRQIDVSKEVVEKIVKKLKEL